MSSCTFEFSVSTTLMNKCIYIFLSLKRIKCHTLNSTLSNFIELRNKSVFTLPDGFYFIAKTSLNPSQRRDLNCAKVPPLEGFREVKN